MAGRPQNLRITPGFRRRISRASSTTSELATVPESPAEHLPRKPHPPNRKQHDSDLKEINDKIAVKEKEIATRKHELQTHTDSTAPAQRDIKNDLDTAEGKLKSIISELKTRSEELTKKEDEINNQRPKITYNDNQKIDQIIRNLEQQRSTKYFSRVDEEKIIKEIDRLKRSKNELAKMNRLKDERGTLQQKVNDLRTERQNCFSSMNDLKLKRMALDQVGNKHRASLETLQREVNDLVARRNYMDRDFQRNAREWERHQAELRRQRYQEKEKTRSSQSSQERKEPPTPIDPYAAIKQLVCSLLTYLQNLKLKEESELQSPSPYATTIPVIIPPLLTTPPSIVIDLEEAEQKQQQPGFFLRRKHEVDAVNTGLGKGTKKDKRKAKPIAHDASVVAQFGELDLFPPATFAEVPKAIEELLAKKEEYDQLTAEYHLAQTPKASPQDETAPPLPTESLPSTSDDRDSVLTQACFSDLAERMRSLSIEEPSPVLSQDEMDDLRHSDTGYLSSMSARKLDDGMDTTSELTNATSARSSIIGMDDFSDVDVASPEIKLIRPAFPITSATINPLPSETVLTNIVNAADVPDGRSVEILAVQKLTDGVCPETPPVDDMMTKPPKFSVVVEKPVKES